MTALSVTAFPDTGLVRARNEDAILVGGWLCQTAVGAITTLTFPDSAPFVCAVADGMGGHAGGDLASRIALGVIADAAPDWASVLDVTAAVRSANERVCQAGVNPNLQGLGTTIAGIAVLAEHVVAFNVGDSRIYSVANGFLEQISVDDAITDESGRPTNLVTQSLGQRQPPSPHVVTMPRDGTSYLLCSDGVSGVLSAAELRTAALKTDPNDFAGELIRMTRERGAQDNFSMLIVTVAPVIAEPAVHATDDRLGSPQNPERIGTEPDAMHSPAAEPAMENS